MNELNNDFVLWITLSALALTIVSLIAFSWKIARGIEGLEEDEFPEDEFPEVESLEDKK